MPADGSLTPRTEVTRVDELIAEELGASANSPVGLAVRARATWQLKRAESYGEAAELLSSTAEQLLTMAAALQRVRVRFDDLHAAHVAQDPFGDAWRTGVRGRLRATADADRRTAWLTLYAQAFAAEAYEACMWLCDDEDVRPDDELTRGLRGSAEAASRRLLVHTLPALELLTDAQYHEQLPDAVRGRCWVMRARALSRGLSEPEAAAGLLEPLLVPEATWPAEIRAKLHVALGEARLEAGDAAAARRAMKSALGMGVPEGGAHVLGGMIAEAAGEAARAEQRYDAALALGADEAVSGALFAPVPPILRWRYGRRIRDDDANRAIEAIEKALDEAKAVTDRAFPEHKAYVDLARTLEREHRSSESARAYDKAARRYAARGDRSTAREYCRLAVRQEPDEAKYRFLYAEALRLEAVRLDGIVDLPTLEEAGRHWAEGIAMTQGHAQSAWVYVTGALISHLRSGDLYRPRVSGTAAAVLERGLLAAPGDRHIIGQLSQAHRLLGNPWTALALTRDGFTGSADDLLFDQQLLALLEVDRPEEAWELLQGRPLTHRTPWLLNRTVQVLLELGHTEQAIDVLGRANSGDDGLHALQLGLCHWLLGHRDDAHKAYRVALELREEVGQRRLNLSAWAAHLVGLHDEAAAIYGPLITADSQDPSLRWEYGQALLARGIADDLEVGARELHAGIAMSRSRYSLSVLDRMDLPRLIALTEEAPHAAAVRDVVGDARTAIAARRGDLAADTPAAELQRCLDDADGAGDDDASDCRRAALAGLARLEAARDPMSALRHYRELALDGAIPEAALGAQRAVGDLWRTAQEAASAGRPADGVEVCESVVSILSATGEGAPSLVADSSLRAALLAARAGQPDRFARHLRAGLAGPNRGEDAVTVADVVDTLPTFWQVRAAAKELQRQGGATAADREAARRLEQLLPLSGLLRTRARDVDPTDLFPLLKPLALPVGRMLWPDDDADAMEAWRSAVSALRTRVDQDLGVVLPGVALSVLTDGADGEFQVVLYGDVQVRDVVAGDLRRGSAEWVATVEDVVRRLEAVARRNLNRLFTIDDVALWLGSGADSPTAPRQALSRTSRSERLELLRLLRLLLREQVPIVDRDAILGELCRLGPNWSAPAALPAVRRRLRADSSPAGSSSGPPPVVPEDLEARLLQGLDPKEPAVWQLGRETASRLTEELADWHESVGSPPTVAVRGDLLRPFVWRLMGMAARFPVSVHCEEGPDVS